MLVIALLVPVLMLGVLLLLGWWEERLFPPAGPAPATDDAPRTDECHAGATLSENPPLADLGKRAAGGRSRRRARRALTASPAPGGGADPVEAVPGLVQDSPLAA